MSCSYSASAVPARIDEKYGAATIGSITPISPVRAAREGARAAVRGEAVIAHDAQHGPARLGCHAGPSR